MAENQNNMSQGDFEEMLDLEKARLSEIKEKKLTKTDRWLNYLGFPLGIIIFALIFFMPTPDGLMVSGQIVLACFALALTWWLTEPLPTHVTSMVLICLLIVLGGWDEKNVLGVLGLDVIWLNIGAFILCSVLVVSGVAKRVAMILILKYGKGAMSAVFAFFLVQLVLAPLIPATAARTVMTLPLMLLVAAIFGSTGGNPNNFGRFLLLHNLHGISIFSSAFITGSTCNIIAAGLIFVMSGERIFYTDWMFGALPVAILMMLASWWIGGKLIFRMSEKESKPQVSGGKEALKKELDKMGPWTFTEKKAGVIFIVVILLWVTDRWHMPVLGFEISLIVTALIGAAIALWPKAGIINWNKADVPWHLLIFSAGAYAGGLALNATDAARWIVSMGFDRLDLVGRQPNFWVVYTIIVAFMAYAGYFFTSKTMRTLIFIPFVVILAQELGYNPVWLALPGAFTLCWVIGLPFNAKPNLILYATGQFSVMDNFYYGFVVKTIGIILLVIFGMTWFRILGITPPFGF
ncbi:MAG: anion transporter [Balneolaceae bacterium]|nr:MAG: anion transporter [Balneolaceae bacterium]